MMSSCSRKSLGNLWERLLHLREDAVSKKNVTATSHIQQVVSGWASSEETGDAFFQHYDAVLNPCRARFLLQQLQRLIHRLVRQPKGTVMHGHPPDRPLMHE